MRTITQRLIDPIADGLQVRDLIAEERRTRKKTLGKGWEYDLIQTIKEGTFGIHWITKQMEEITNPKLLDFLAPKCPICSFRHCECEEYEDS